MRKTDFHKTQRVEVAGAILEDVKTLSFHLLYGPSCQIFLSGVVHYMRWHLADRAAADGKPMTADVADAKSDILYLNPDINLNAHPHGHAVINQSLSLCWEKHVTFILL